MADTRPDIQPAALIPHQPKEIQRQHVADRHHAHEQRTRRQVPESAVQDAEVRADEGEGDEELEQEEGALGEGGEDGEEAVDAVEGEGGEGGDVGGGEEGGLEVVEEEEGGAEVGEGEGAVGCGFAVRGRVLRGGGGEFGADGG